MFPESIPEINSDLGRAIEGQFAVRDLRDEGAWVAGFDTETLPNLCLGKNGRCTRGVDGTSCGDSGGHGRLDALVLVGIERTSEVFESSGADQERCR
jgi:hypothetical protein